MSTETDSLPFTYTHEDVKYEGEEYYGGVKIQDPIRWATHSESVYTDSSASYVVPHIYNIDEGLVVKLSQKKSSLKTPFVVKYVFSCDPEYKVYSNSQWVQIDFLAILVPLNKTTSCRVVMGHARHTKQNYINYLDKQFTVDEGKINHTIKSIEQYLEELNEDDEGTVVYAMKNSSSLQGIERINTVPRSISVLSDISVIELLDLEHPDMIAAYI